MRVLPEDLYDLVMNSDTPIGPGEVFDEVSRRRERQQRERERLRREGLTLNQWQDWQNANEPARRKGLA